MTTRVYGQYCGLARALEIVGERWALLIVRDLLVGPRRFTDLRQGLPKIPTNVLSTRLKELEQAGVVTRRVLPRPSGAIVYELTPDGRQLETVVLALGRWGAQRLDAPRDGEVVTPDSITMALRSTFDPDAARGVHVVYEFRLGDDAVHARVDDGALEAGPGEIDDPDLTLEAGPWLRDLMSGEVSAGELVASGHLHLTGDPELLGGFARLFRIAERPAATAA